MPSIATLTVLLIMNIISGYDNFPHDDLERQIANEASVDYQEVDSLYSR